MPPKSSRPLRRVNLNLFESDCLAMERRYGHGWTEQVRELLRKHVLKHDYGLGRYDVFTGETEMIEDDF